jgi:Delta3,5-Delta2,4-dienoyl-CoA isomerase
VNQYGPLTARKFLSSEAKEIGLVSRLFESRETMINLTLNVAKAIAAKSPVAVQGTKVNLNYSRDHSVRDGLENMVRQI